MSRRRHLAAIDDSRKAESAVGAYAAFHVGLAGYDAVIGVVTRTPVRVGTLAQGVHVHLVDELFPLANGEQPAGLLSLAPYSLKPNGTGNGRLASYKSAGPW